MAQRTRKNKGKEAVQKKSGPSTMTLVLGAVGVLAVGLLVWNIVSTATDETARSPVELEYESPAELLAMAQPAVRGDPDAPVTLMDFSDYSCSACQQFTLRLKPTLDRQYVSPGYMQFAYYDFPTGMFPNSFTASRAARCAGDQNAYWPFHDRLFQMQSSWSTQADPVGTFEDYAEELGLDSGQFESCLRSDMHAEVVSANLELGRQLGVGGTPTIMLNTGEGSPVRVQDWTQTASVQALIDDVLARAGVNPGAEEGAPEGDADGDDAGGDA